MTLTRSQFENLYKKESDSKVKERLFLVMKVEGDGIVPACVAKDIHRSRTWASDWLARYHKEGIAGLKDRPKSGRPSELSSEVILRIKKILKESTHKHCFKRRERRIQKRAQKILDDLPKGFTVVSLDESLFFFFNYLIRKVWIEEHSRPVVTVTGSH